MGFFCDTEPFKSRHSFPVSEEQSLSNEWLPAKIVIGSSLKPTKVVKNVWKKCQTNDCRKLCQVTTLTTISWACILYKEQILTIECKLTKVQLNIPHFQCVRLPMFGNLTWCRYHTLDEVIGDLKQQLKREEKFSLTLTLGDKTLLSINCGDGVESGVHSILL